MGDGFANHGHWAGVCRHVRSMPLGKSNVALRYFCGARAVLFLFIAIWAAAWVQGPSCGTSIAKLGSGRITSKSGLAFIQLASKAYCCPLELALGVSRNQLLEHRRMTEGDQLAEGRDRQRKLRS